MSKRISDPLDLLRAELSVYDIDFGRLGASEAFLDELHFALAVKKHERKIAPYGAIFCDDLSALEGLQVISMLPEKLDLARELADGTRSFTLYEGPYFKGEAVFGTPLKEEIDFVSLRRKSECLILRRNQSGLLKVFSERGIGVHEHRVWQFRPTVEAVMPNIKECAPQVDEILLKDILEFAFHQLSSNNIGATLVWFLASPTEDEMRNLAAEKDLSDLSINIQDRTLTPILKQLLFSTDGATIITPDGNVISTAAQLRYSERSKEFIPQTKGTRHTSAIRFSFDLSKVIVFAVSEDGPVTIYSDGVNVATLSNYASFDAMMSIYKMIRSADRDLAEGMSHYMDVRKCPNCGKTSLVEEIYVPLWREREEAYCPICRSEIYTALCHRLDAHIIKTIDD